MKKWFKRIAITFGILLVLILAAAITLPFLFKDKIMEVAKSEINNRVNAKVNFSDLDLSVLRSFPNFNMRLTDFEIKGIGEFEGIKLVSLKNLDLTLDLFSVINGGNPYKVQSIHLEKPEINVLVLRNGKANYDIAKPSPPTATGGETTPFALKLKKYSISDGKITYNDKSSGIYLVMDKLNHSGKGDFSNDIYDIATQTDIGAWTFETGGITYLNKAVAKMDISINADMPNSKFTLRDNDISINALRVKADGFVQPKGDNINMDLKFDAPSNTFKNFLSLIPGAYIQGYENVKANGSFSLNGAVKGTYNGLKNQMPAFNLNLKIGNADFQYPDLPMGVSGINAQIDVKSPGSNFDLMSVDIPALKFKLGNNPFDATFKLRTPISDPDIDTKVNGIIVLDDLSKAFPMEGIDKLSGIISANIAAKTRMSYIDKKEYEKVNMAGKLRIQKMMTVMKGQPAIYINDLQTDFTPNNVKLINFDAKLGKSDLKAQGVIDNILAYFSPDKTMTGNLTLRSNLFDANEWISNESTPSSGPSAPASANEPAPDEKVFDRFNFTLDAAMNRINYDKYVLTNTVAKGNFTPDKFTLTDMRTQIGKNDIQVNGVVTNVFNYLFANEILGGNINISSQMMDLNDFMTSAPASASTTAAPAQESEIILIPKNMDLQVHTNMNKVLYTNMELNNLTGNLSVKNEEIRIDDAKVNTLGGAMGIAGGYNTQNHAKPTFNLKYDIAGFDFQKTFLTLNTVQSLAPVAKYIDGKFNTTLVMSGALGKGMVPDFNSLNAAGFLQTLQGVLKGLKPLEEVGNKLNISYLKSMDLKGTKNWIEIKNGVVDLKEFDYKLKDVAMKIGGKHSLTADMDYYIKAKVPRKMLEQNAVGAAVGSGYNMLLKEASKYGVNIQNGEFVNVMFNLTGSMANPKVGMKLLGSDGQAAGESAQSTATAVFDKAKDSLKNRASEELDKAKVAAKQAGDKIVDTVSKVVNKQVEEAKNKVVEEAKNKATEVLGKEVGGKVGDQVGKKVGDEVGKAAGDKAKKEADKLKDQLDSFDPFGTKKKDNKDPKKKGGN